MTRHDIDIERIIEIAKAAGERILEIYEQDFAVFEKDDASPLTEADQAANAVILDGLRSSYADIPFISEEEKNTDYAERADWDACWLIDPLDGTKEFIKKNGEFTVNIALIEGGEPVLGVVYVPARSETYFAMRGEGAYKETADGGRSRIENRTHYRDLDTVRVVASRSHLSDEVVAFVDRLKAEGKQVEFQSSGSSLKFCLVAEGSADVYPRFAPTMEWDTGAAHAVCLEAGKQVLRYPEMEPLTYNREELLNPWFIVE